MLPGGPSPKAIRRVPERSRSHYRPDCFLAKHRARDEASAYTLMEHLVGCNESHELALVTALSPLTVRRRANGRQNAVLVGGRIHAGTPTSHEVRSVPFPAFLVDELAAQFAGRSQEQVIFGDAHNHMLTPQRETAGTAQRSSARKPPTTPLSGSGCRPRHDAASMAVSASANAKAVQRMLGHASAAMTLDTYADLFDDDLGAVADALDQECTDSVVSIPRQPGGRSAPATAQHPPNRADVTSGQYPQRDSNPH
jgi:hypothetical protein